VPSDARRSQAAAACALLAVLAVLVTGCTTSGDAQGANGYITGAGIVTTVKPADRQDVPAIAGKTIHGDTFDIADARGKVVVVNIWASWCPPCRAEADDLVAADQELGSAVFVGIDVRDERSAAEAFIRHQSVPYDSILDEDGGTMLSFYGMLSPNSLPSTFVIDQQGRIAALVLGSVTTSTLVGLVEDVENET
jgi:thiol-disulfide isomerase/thioredoxin